MTRSGASRAQRNCRSKKAKLGHVQKNLVLKQFLRVAIEARPNGPHMSHLWLCQAGRTCHVLVGESLEDANDGGLRSQDEVWGAERRPLGLAALQRPKNVRFLHSGKRISNE